MMICARFKEEFFHQHYGTELIWALQGKTSGTFGQWSKWRAVIKCPAHRWVIFVLAATKDILIFN